MQNRGKAVITKDSDFHIFKRNTVVNVVGVTHIDQGKHIHKQLVYVVQGKSKVTGTKVQNLVLPNGLRLAKTKLGGN